MKELVSGFDQVRDAFLEAVDEFPRQRREEILFGEWSLRMVLAHLAGWDTYFTEILKRLKEGGTIPYWGSIGRFNQKSVRKRQTTSWDQVHREFMGAGEDFLREYGDLPEEMADCLLWGSRSYTPAKILEINIHHYEKSHLEEIRRVMDQLERDRPAS